MTIRKSILTTTAALLLASGYSHAALVDGSTLWFGNGSYFSMEVSPGFHFQTQITSLNGIILGTSQYATGSHTGIPDGSEYPNIDNPWVFFSNTGMHFSSSAVSVLADDGTGNATIDMSGWNITWNGINIPMGSGAWDGNLDGIGTVRCTNTCGALYVPGWSDHNPDVAWEYYTLDYTATVPIGDPSGFGGVRYALHLTNAPVPLPPAIWLFGSGILSLIGVFWRNKNSQVFEFNKRIKLEQAIREGMPQY